MELFLGYLPQRCKAQHSSIALHGLAARMSGPELWWCLIDTSSLGRAAQMEIFVLQAFTFCYMSPQMQ